MVLIFVRPGVEAYQGKDRIQKLDPKSVKMGNVLIKNGHNDDGCDFWVKNTLLVVTLYDFGLFLALFLSNR